MVHPDRENGFSRRGFLNFSMLKASEGLGSALDAVQDGVVKATRVLEEARLDRRQLEKLGLGLGLSCLLPNLGRWELAALASAASFALVLASLDAHMNQAIANAQGFRIEDIPYEEGNGARSYMWLRGTEGYGNLTQLDDASEILRGYRVPKPTADYLYEWALADMAGIPNGAASYGDCMSAGLAAGASPYFDGGNREAFGVVFPGEEVEVLIPLHHRYSKELQSWKAPIDRKKLDEIWAKHVELQATSGPRPQLIFNTGANRGLPGIEWWGWLKGFDGDGNPILVDFFERSELIARKNEGKNLQKLYGPVPYNSISEVQLRNPNEWGDGLEAGFKYTVDRDVVKVLLGKARAVPL